MTDGQPLPEDGDPIPMPGLAVALFPVLATMAMMFVQLVVFEAFIPHVPLLVGSALTAIVGRLRGYRWLPMEQGLFRVVQIGLPSAAIMMNVGMIISTWMLSGTVPVMIYYGLKMISPQFFLLAAMLICAVVSVSLGTSWGTVGTMGIALVGIGEGLNVPMHLTGGAIVSGAFFGDKISPLSDTTNLAPAVTGTDLFDHIRNMIATTLPAMLVAAVVYIVIGLRFSADTLSADKITQITGALESGFNLSLWLLLPPVLVITLAIRRTPPLPALFAGIAAGALAAFIAQDASAQQIFSVMQGGYVSKTGVEAVDKLLSKGGLQSMMWIVSLLIIALSFGGLLEKTRCLEALLGRLIRVVQGRFGLVASSTFGAIGTNMITGDPYLSITLPGRMFGPAYRGQGLSLLNLARSLEEGGTLINPLIPWAAGGSFVTKALGISTLSYLPFAFACWIAPLLGLFYAAIGRFVPMAGAAERRRWADNGEMVLRDGQLVPAEQPASEGDR